MVIVDTDVEEIEPGTPIVMFGGATCALVMGIEPIPSHNMVSVRYIWRCDREHIHEDTDLLPSNITLGVLTP